MFQKMQSYMLVLMIIGLAFAISGCNDSSSSTEIKGYPNSKLIATSADMKDSDIIILDARNAGAYTDGHIPGAVSMAWGQFSDSGLDLLPVNELETMLSSLGLTRNTKMIIYDDTISSWGASGRLFWMLEYLGCDRVRILDGGWDKWTADGNTVETAANTLPAADFIAETNTSIVVGKGHIANRMNDDDFAIIDTRTDAEFIGWQLYGEARGGHITGAVQIPYEWYFKADKTILDYKDMQEMFEAHGVSKDKEVTAYCTAGIRSAYAYFLCRLMGYDRASNYDASMWDWAAANQTTYPMDALHDYEKLVHPGWLKQLIDDDIKPDGTDGYLIVECGWGTSTDTGYDVAHIPGAIHVNTDEIEYDEFFVRTDPPADQWFGRSTTEEEDAAKGLGPDDTLPRNWWNLYPDEYLIPAIAYMGITTDTTVIVYSAVPEAAGRVLWALMYAGVKDIRLLNGGLSAWQAAGYEVSNQDVPRTPAANFGATEALHPELIVDNAYIRAIANGNEDPDALIVDIRTWDEYTGASAPYSYIPNSGRVKNAVWGHCGDTLADMNAFVDVHDGTLRSFTEVEAMWGSDGITSDKIVSYYCGTGWRAALTAFYAHIMGWENVSLFDSGWYEWSMGPEKDINPMIDEYPNLP